MIYSFLKILSRLTIWGYFRKVKIVGKSNIPDEGPYLFVANHPSAFMDPIVVATSIKPPVYFIAAGEYVGKGLKGWVFQKLLHMIPVYRPSTRPEDAHKNADMFLKCHLHLEKKGTLLIFPEGVSLTEKKLKPLKTGTVRIVLGAEIKNAFNLDIPIIPIGLNYSNPHEFRSDLFVKIGTPIYLKNFINGDYSTKILEKEEEIELTKEITAYIEEKMQSLILHIDEEDDEVLLSKLNAVFSREVKKQYEIGYSDQEEELDMQRDFLKAIHFYRDSDSIAFYSTLNKVDEYLEELERFGLSDKDIGEFKNQYLFKRVFTYFFGLPFFLFGWINNIIPYRGVGWIAKKIRMDATFQGSLSLAIGLFLFLAWYSLITTLLFFTDIGFYALLYPVISYITGIYALIYLTAFKHSMSRIKLRKIAKEDRSTMTRLMDKRTEIIAIILRVQAEYLGK